jgi:cobalt/nickel transport system ATP-binding protein
LSFDALSEDVPVFSLRDVCYRYPTGALALDGVSFAVTKGESVAVLGANGCGKSTLLRLLDGLISAPSGTFHAWGEEVTEEALEDDGFAWRLRRRIGLVFQDADAMLFCPSVYEELAFGPTLLGLAKEAVAARVESLLDLCSLGHLARRAPYELSGGEKRRVCMAAALSTDPGVLLLDEPTTGLDPRSRDWLTDMLLDLRGAGRTILLATHDLALAREVSERALVLCEGHHLIGDGIAASVLGDRALLRMANLISSRAERRFEDDVLRRT